MKRLTLPSLALLTLATATGCAAGPGRALASPASVALARPAVGPPATPPRGAASLEADVAALAGTDFAPRQRAARRLVAAAEEALPALGQAGDQPVVGVGAVAVSSTRPVVRTILEALGDARVRALVKAPWPNVRRDAAEDLGRRGRLGAVPALLAGLEDEDVDVRAASDASLRRLSGRFHGYRANAPPAVRAAATARWRAWWQTEGRLGVREDGTGAG